jgi:hypothetical protein
MSIVNSSDRYFMRIKVVAIVHTIWMGKVSKFNIDCVL